MKEKIHFTSPLGQRHRRLRLEPLEPRLALDSTVVFNELMYHPSGEAEQPFEWIELRNQMAVDMDVSRWSLAGGVEFEFPEGTTVPGGGYLVVATDPAALAAATGFADALGPFTGRLSNGGERVELLNNNLRVMDAIQYGDGGDWPVAADGSGASLAKFDPDSASEPAGNWRSSTEVGGTPGDLNFAAGPLLGPEVSLLQIDSPWWYNDSGTDLGVAWREVDYAPEAAGWQLGTAPLADQAASSPMPAGTSLSTGVNTYYFRTEFDFAGDPNVIRLSIDHLVDDGAVFYLNGAEIYRFNMPPGPVSYETEAAGTIRGASFSGSTILPADGLTVGTNLLAVEVHQAGTGVLQGVTLIDSGGDDGAGGVPDNLALQSNGAAAFAADVLPGYAIHQIEHLNDGRYGNGNSWIGNSTDSFAGVAFDGAYTIDRIALGRDNGGEATQYTDRWGSYTLQYTTVATPGRDTPDHAWDEIAVLAYGGGFPDATPWLRHVWGFTPIANVTGVRIVTHEKGLCIDEIEVYEPALPDVVFGSELTAAEILDPPSLLLSEVAGADDGTFWLEIVNSGEMTVSAGGVIIATSRGREFALSPQSIPAGGFISFDQTQLGFAADLGEGVFLYNAGRSAVLDATRVEARLTGRSEQHDGRWFYPDAPSRDLPNTFAFHDEIAISEIMYHPFEFQPGEAVGDEWLELYNRGSHTVDLTGWTIQDAIDFDFPAGTTVEPGGYLVVAKDAGALQAQWPDVQLVGDFSRSLSDRHDRILLVDANGNPADEVHYYDGGRWPEYADGGGSSLELRDPDADNSRPEAWAASREGDNSSWATYTYRGVARSDGGATLYNEFVLGLLDAGEVLLDDVSVIEDPDGSATELLQNGSFESGTASKWRILGTHQGTVVTDPEDPANQVLHLVTTDAAEDRLNHAETTFLGNRAIVNGRQYEISFRAKWLGGSNQLNTRLYFNRLPATTPIDVPQLNGTPGAPNSTLQTDIGPTYDGLAHSPVIPNPGQPVTVSIRTADPDGVDGSTLWYSVDGGEVQGVAMSHSGRGEYQGMIPGQGTASVVQFYVEAADMFGARSFFPAAGPESRALYKVQDNQARGAAAHNFRIIMTAADAAFLHKSTNQLSNGRLGATVVSKESEVFYDVGVRLKGSNAGRADARWVCFNVRFDPMQLFRGVHETVAVDRSGRGAAVSLGQDEILVKHMINHAGGIPGMYDDLIYLIAPNPVHNRSASLMMARYGDEYLDSQFDNGADGTVFKLDIQYVPNGTLDGNRESLKVPSPYHHPPPKDLADYGDDKEAYRWHLLIRNNRAEDDYSRIIELSQALSRSGVALAEAVDPLMDYDEWARTFAMQSLVGVTDAYFRSSLHHNVSFYVPPDDGKVLALPWDWDLGIFGSTSAPLVGSYSTFRKVVSLPGNLRVFQGHLLDLIDTTFNAEYMARWIDHYGSVAGQNFGPVLNYINGRRSYVLRNLPAQVPFQITTNGGEDFSVDADSVILEGTGWIDVREVRLEGSDEPLEVAWTNQQTWQVKLPLDGGPNRLTFQTVDFQGNSAGTDSITVTSTDPDRPLQQSLRITELNYHPYDPTPAEMAAGFTDSELFEFVELQNISPDETLDLSGVRFSDAVELQFTGSYQGPPVLITEISTASEDYVEVQNISERTVDTSGWAVAVNNSVGQDVNEVNAVRWQLPDTMAAGEVLYATDNEANAEHFWGENILWSTSGSGWVMIVDEAGNVADFVAWGYGAEDVESLSIQLNGFQITAHGAWIAEGVPAEGRRSNSLQRSGNQDHDDVSDWAFVKPTSQAAANAGLTTPFAGDAALAPGGFVVVVADRAAFRTRYGDQTGVAGQYEGSLRNSGERVTLSAPSGRQIVDFEYDDSGPWPGSADGKGASLELTDPAAAPQDDSQRADYLSNGDNWRRSSEVGGSPGAAGEGPRGDVLVNEVLTRTDAPQTDAIELINTTDSPVDVGGWYLSDSSDDYRKYRIAEGTTIPGHGYLVFDETDFNPTPLSPQPNHFALSGVRGDDVWLVEADAEDRLTRFVDHVEFPAAAVAESFGRWPDGEGGLYPMLSNTLDPTGANSGPRVGPVVISEVHYRPDHAQAADLEFVEIYNPTGQSVDLTGWQIRKGIDFDFPDGALLASGAAMVVVPFDPQDAVKLAAFRAHYGINESAPIVGGYSGALSDNGEKVRLQRPGVPSPDKPDLVPYLLEDEANYGVLPPWPAAAGNGHSLHRRGADLWGHTPDHWTSAPATPGTADLTPAVVVDRYIFYNNSAFDDHARGLTDDDAIATDKEALLPGAKAELGNYTNYVRGINGIMIDVGGLAGSPTAADFRFRIGNDNGPAGWTTLAGEPTVTTREGAGVGGSHRVTIIWPDNTVANQWLEVTVLATADTGLAEPDVFYFGNAIGEAGNSTLNAVVDATDEIAARNFPHGPANPAVVDDPYDYNRDRLVNTTDRAIARNNQTKPTNMLRLITAPAADVYFEQAVAQQSSNDGLPSDTLAWLYGSDQTIMNSQPQKKQTPAAEAVAELLAMSWQRTR